MYKTLSLLFLILYSTLAIDIAYQTSFQGCNRNNECIIKAMTTRHENAYFFINLEANSSISTLMHKDLQYGPSFSQYWGIPWNTNENYIFITVDEEYVYLLNEEDKSKTLHVTNISSPLTRPNIKIKIEERNFIAKGLFVYEGYVYVPIQIEEDLKIISQLWRINIQNRQIDAKLILHDFENNNFEIEKISMDNANGLMFITSTVVKEETFPVVLQINLDSLYIQSIYYPPKNSEIIALQAHPQHIGFVYAAVKLDDGMIDLWKMHPINETYTSLNKTFEGGNDANIVVKYREGDDYTSIILKLSNTLHHIDEFTFMEYKNSTMIPENHDIMQMSIIGNDSLILFTIKENEYFIFNVSGFEAPFRGPEGYIAPTWAVILIVALLVLIEYLLIGGFCFVMGKKSKKETDGALTPSARDETTIQ